MTVEKVVCDECGRVKAESNHWHEVGVSRCSGGVTIELGVLRTAGDPVHDLCGEQCFHKHIAKLLGFNPPAAIEDEQ